MRQLLIAASCLVGCNNNGSLVFVTVDSVAPIASAARLHVTLVNGSAMQSNDLTLSPATFPPSHSFAVDVSPGIGGNLRVSVEAFNSAGTSVGSASGSVAIVAGGRADISLTLGAGAPADLSVPADAGAPPDLAYRALTWVPQQVVPGTAGDVVWASDANHIWIGADNMNGNLYSTGNDVWMQVATIPSYQSSGLWGTDASHVFLVDTSGYIRAWDPNTTNWSTIHQVANGTMPWLTGIWGSSLNDIYLSGKSNGATPTEYIFHNTTGNIASGWTLAQVAVGPGLNGISGTTGHVYAIGPVGRILHSSDGTNWNSLPQANVNLRGIFVLDAQHVYVVGDSGTILFSSGNGMFAKQTVPSVYATVALAAVWAAGPNDVFAVGANGVLHGDATGTWVAQTSGLEVQAVDINSVWGTSARNVYVTGGNWVSHGQ